MRNALKIMMLLSIIMLASQNAHAAAKTYSVLPFFVDAPASLKYLEQAVVPMLNSRLYVKGQLEPISESISKKLKAVKNSDDANKALKASGANYLVWGAIKVEGDSALVDMRVIGEKSWKKTQKAPLSALISTLQNMSAALNAEVFGRGARGSNVGSSAKRSAPSNNNFVVNESAVGKRDVYLNSQFRYEGADGNRHRSQALPIVSIGMVLADVTGDKNNDIVILAEDRIQIYSWGYERMELISERTISRTMNPLSIRSIDLDGDKVHEIIISMFDADNTAPYSFIYSAKGKAITPIVENIPYFLNVVKLPPAMTPTLIGQRGTKNSDVFDKVGVYQMMLNGNSLLQGSRIAIPDDGNVMNFTWLPDSAKDGGNKMVVLTKDENIAVYSDKLSRMYLSDEKFSGTAIGIDEQTNMSGLGVDDVTIPRRYYIPMRMIAADLEGNGDYTLLANKPISVTAQFFDRYRFFPEGEISDLYWDGVGLSLLWKTRRIKGSVSDFAVGDIANDGGKSLVVCINTHPGAIGTAKRKTIILSYPLDASQTDDMNSPIQ